MRAPPDRRGFLLPAVTSGVLFSYTEPATKEECTMAYSDRELLARLIECEAGGEGENGMKAVAGVVMNRH